MAAPNLGQQLAQAGGYRNETAIQNDVDEATSAMIPRKLERFKSVNGGAPDASHPDVQLTTQMSASLATAHQHALLARTTNNPDTARQEMQFAHGYMNEVASHQRLRDDIANQPDAALALQTRMNVGMNGRIPDAMIAHTGNPAQGVVVREMKTRNLNDSAQQLHDLAGAAHPHAQAVQVQWPNAPQAVRVHMLEVEMRSSSRDLSAQTIGQFQNLSHTAGGNLRVRTNSMTSFEPINVVQARRDVHGV